MKGGGRVVRKILTIHVQVDSVGDGAGDVVIRDSACELRVQVRPNKNHYFLHNKLVSLFRNASGNLELFDKLIY